jgi:hypothetical protein
LIEYTNLGNSVPLREVTVTPCVAPHPIEQLLISAAQTDTFKSERSFSTTQINSPNFSSTSIPIQNPNPKNPIFGNSTLPSSQSPKMMSPPPLSLSRPISSPTNQPLDFKPISSTNSFLMTSTNNGFQPASLNNSAVSKRSFSTSQGALTTKRAIGNIPPSSSIPSILVRNAIGEAVAVPNIEGGTMNDGTISCDVFKEYFGHVNRYVIQFV